MSSSNPVVHRALDEEIGGAAKSPLELPEAEHELALQRVMARMLDQDEPPEVTIGRYEYIRRLGAGGMGVVYLARDPDLDRLVALKVLRSRTGEPDERALIERRMRREARAMARLDHPHVVRVHEVGEDAGRTYIAMEYVEGTTFGRWLESDERGWEDVIRAFVAAGEGLAAAHAEGLSHCDFKPENVLMGRGGAIKVSDFGLARSHTAEPSEPLRGGPSRPIGSGLTTDADELRGTPVYMAPEQLEGGRGDPTSDQFSYCVALYSALYRARPFEGRTLQSRWIGIKEGLPDQPPAARSVPAALWPIVSRGLSFERQRRWPSMDALLTKLRWVLGARARRRRRALIGSAGLVLLVIAGAAGYERHATAARTRACAAQGNRIDEVWNDQTRARVRDGLVATGLSYAATTAETVVPWLDGWADDWRSHRREACMATDVHERLPLELSARARWCLEVRRLQFEEVVRSLSTADDATARAAVSSTTHLPPTSVCLDRAVLETLTAPPEDARPGIVELLTAQARARALEEAGKYEQALELTDTTLARAQAIAWPSLTAALHGDRGRLLGYTGALDEAATVLESAYSEAVRARAWVEATSIATDAVFVVGYRQAKPELGRAWARSAETAALVAGDPMGLQRADRLDALGVVENTAGRYREAVALHEQALALQQDALGPDHPRLNLKLTNLANARKSQGDHEGARALYERSLALEREAYGAEHPVLATTLNNLATVDMEQGRLASARDLLGRALEIRRAALGPEHRDVAAASSNLGVVHREAREYAEAIARFEEALAIFERVRGADHPSVAMMLSNIATTRIETGALDEAEAELLRALAIIERAWGAEHPSVAQILGNLAEVSGARGDRAIMRERLERAVVIRTRALGPEHPKVAYLRDRLAELEQSIPIRD